MMESCNVKRSAIKKAAGLTGARGRVVDGAKHRKVPPRPGPEHIFFTPDFVHSIGFGDRNRESDHER